jgi:hypothetical protein
LNPGGQVKPGIDGKVMDVGVVGVVGRGRVVTVVVSTGAAVVGVVVATVVGAVAAVVFVACAAG